MLQEGQTILDSIVRFSLLLSRSCNYHDRALNAASFLSTFDIAKYSPFSRMWHQQAKAELAKARLSPIARRLLELLRIVNEKKKRQAM